MLSERKEPPLIAIILHFEASDFEVDVHTPRGRPDPEVGALYNILMVRKFGSANETSGF